MKENSVEERSVKISKERVSERKRGEKIPIWRSIRFPLLKSGFQKHRTGSISEERLPSKTWEGERKKRKKKIGTREILTLMFVSGIREEEKKERRSERKWNEPQVNRRNFWILRMHCHDMTHTHFPFFSVPTHRHTVIERYFLVRDVRCDTYPEYTEAHLETSWPKFSLTPSLSLDGSVCLMCLFTNDAVFTTKCRLYVISYAMERRVVVVVVLCCFPVFQASNCCCYCSESPCAAGTINNLQQLRDVWNHRETGGRRDDEERDVWSRRLKIERQTAIWSRVGNGETRCSFRMCTSSELVPLLVLILVQ